MNDTPETAAPVGFSTGAIALDDVASGTATAELHAAPAGRRLVELSALHSDALPRVEAVWSSGAAAGFDRVSVHAPIKGTPPPVCELVARLARLELDVVAHPDAMLTQCDGDLTAWEPLGSRLLVENNDGRKDFGATVADLTSMFDRLPEARMCLDVSHALHAGGTYRLRELVDRFGPRIAQLHVGCSCGEQRGWVLDRELLAATHDTVELLGWAPPAVMERSCLGAPASALIAQRDGVLDAVS